jgi:hypothetical protein
MNGNLLKFDHNDRVIMIVVLARDLWKSCKREKEKHREVEVQHNLAAQEDNNYKSAAIIQ